MQTRWHINQDNVDADQVCTSTSPDQNAEPSSIDNVKVRYINSKVANAVVNGFVKKATHISTISSIEVIGHDNHTRVSKSIRHQAPVHNIRRGRMT
jgi:hypothetical protein